MHLRVHAHTHTHTHTHTHAYTLLTQPYTHAIVCDHFQDAIRQTLPCLNVFLAAEMGILYLLYYRERLPVM